MLSLTVVTEVTMTAFSHAVAGFQASIAEFFLLYVATSLNQHHLGELGACVKLVSIILTKDTLSLNLPQFRLVVVIVSDCLSGENTGLVFLHVSEVSLLSASV